MSNINNTAKMNQTDAKVIEQWISVQPKTLLEFVPSAKKRVFEQTKHNQIMNKTSTNISNLGVLPNEIISYVIEFLKNSLETFLAIRLCSSYLYKTTLNVCVVLFKSIQLENKAQHLSETVSQPVLEKIDNRLQTMHILTRLLVHNPQAIGLYHKEIAAYWQWLNKCEPNTVSILLSLKDDPLIINSFKSLPMRRVLFLYLYRSLHTYLSSNKNPISRTNLIRLSNLFKANDLEHGDYTLLTTLLLNQDEIVFEATITTLKNFIKKNIINKSFLKNVFNEVINLFPIIKNQNNIVFALQFLSYLILNQKYKIKDWCTKDTIENLKALFDHENYLSFAKFLILVFGALALYKGLKKEWATKDLFNNLTALLFNEESLPIAKREISHALGGFVLNGLIEKSWITKTLFDKLISLLVPENNNTSETFENTIFVMGIFALTKQVSRDWFTKDAFDNTMNSLKNSNPSILALRALIRLAGAGFIKQDWVTKEIKNKLELIASNSHTKISKTAMSVLEKFQSL